MLCNGVVLGLGLSEVLLQINICTVTSESSCAGDGNGNSIIWENHGAGIWSFRGETVVYQRRHLLLSGNVRLLTIMVLGL